MKVNFVKSIYKKEAMEAAISAFSEIAKVKMHAGRVAYEVDIECLEPEFENIITGEFANYCLAETANLRESGEIDDIKEG